MPPAFLMCTDKCHVLTSKARRGGGSAEIFDAFMKVAALVPRRPPATLCLPKPSGAPPVSLHAAPVLEAGLPCVTTNGRL